MACELKAGATKGRPSGAMTGRPSRGTGRRGRVRSSLVRRGLLAAVIGCLACTAPARQPSDGAPFVHRVDADTPNPPRSDESYLDRVAVRDEFGDTWLMHWPVRKMPLAVHLPRPPEDLFEDPASVFEAVRGAVLAWTDVASPGVPSFRFVDDHGDADIPIVWAEKPDGAWYIAFCSYHTRPRRNLFDVEHLLVTGRWGGGAVATTDQIHEVVLHEMGHALGLAGHSNHPGDIMYPSISIDGTRRLSERDRTTLRELYARGNRQVRGTPGRPD